MFFYGRCYTLNCILIVLAECGFACMDRYNRPRFVGQILNGKGLGVQPTMKKLAVVDSTIVFVSDFGLFQHLVFFCVSVLVIIFWIYLPVENVVNIEVGLRKNGPKNEKKKRFRSESSWYNALFLRPNRNIGNDDWTACFIGAKPPNLIGCTTSGVISMLKKL